MLQQVDHDVHAAHEAGHMQWGQARLQQQKTFLLSISMRIIYLMNLYEDVDIISFIRLSRLRWIGHVVRMEKERKVYNIFYNNPQGTRVRGRPTNRWMDFVLSDIKK